MTATAAQTAKPHLPAYPAYKDSGIDWLGQIPKHWEVWKAAHAYAGIGSGTTPPSEDMRYYDGDVPWLTTSELRENVITDTQQKVTKFALNSLSALRMFPVGTLAIAMYGATIGRLGILGIEACTNQACCCFPTADVIDSKFTYYWLFAFRQQIIGLSSGGGQPNINQQKLSSLRISTPPLSEQHDIVSFLDRETGRIDALIAKKERQIELLHEKRAALISHAVTKGLDPNAPLKDSGIAWLGQIPEHWATPPLYARYAVELGKMLDAKRITGQSLAPYLRNIDVQWDRVNIDNLPVMDVSPNEYKRYLLRKGDILVCEGGEVGRSAIWQGEIEICAFQKALHRVRPRTQRDMPRFFFYIMRAAAWTGIFLAQGNPNTIPHLTAEKLRVYRFPFPPLHEQKEIVSYLDQESGKIDGLIEKIQVSIDKLCEYRTALISAAVTGKIDVRGEVA